MGIIFGLWEHKAPKPGFPSLVVGRPLQNLLNHLSKRDSKGHFVFSDLCTAPWIVMNLRGPFLTLYLISREPALTSFRIMSEEHISPTKGDSKYFKVVLRRKKNETLGMRRFKPLIFLFSIAYKCPV